MVVARIQLLKRFSNVIKNKNVYAYLWFIVL